MWPIKAPASGKVVAEKIITELRAQTIDLLEKRAEAWIGENMLIHAGAARRLAQELRQKLDNDTE